MRIVKYTNPTSDAERACRMVVLEDRGDRLHVRHLNTGMSIAPTECFAAHNYETVVEVPDSEAERIYREFGR